MLIDLHDRFHAAKTYGKTPEALESIVAIFLRDLGHYSAQVVMDAIALHSRRSAEFPTVADIDGLIRRNGRPPLSEAMYVAIQRKRGEDRTPEDWQYLRDFEADQRGVALYDENEIHALRAEVGDVRRELRAAKDEARRWHDLLQHERKQRVEAAKEYTPPTELEKAARTIAVMQRAHAPHEDIVEFASAYGITIKTAQAAETTPASASGEVAHGQ